MMFRPRATVRVTEEQLKAIEDCGLFDLVLGSHVFNVKDMSILNRPDPSYIEITLYVQYAGEEVQEDGE